jgi:CBS domain-containing protein
MAVLEYCRREPKTATGDESLRQAAERMEQERVGSLVVVDDQQRPIGMLTDRDVVLAAIARRLDASTTPVHEIMHEPVVTVTEGSPVSVAIRFMRQYRLRRIPVVDHENGRLRGILSLDDVVQLLAEELGSAAELIRMQVPAQGGGRLATVSASAGE